MTKITMFQYKIIHNILKQKCVSLKLKYPIMIIMCPKCLTDRYSLNHMLSHCPLALSFWSSFENW